MQDWKIRQEIYHRITVSHEDDLSQFNIELTENIVDDAVRYFNECNIGWVYPSKSYMVGICYAKWLSEEFGEDPKYYLSDPELLYNNDPYFVEYSKDPETYNNILDKINGWNFNQNLGMVPDVYEYFKKEFLLNE
jgi:hypothetical protein